MFFTADLMWHLSPILLMFGMVTLNHLIMHHRAERRYALEAGRLRSALLAELRALHKVYLANLDLIDRKANYLLSTRPVAAVYRGNLPRLTSLFEPPVIEPLVTWFAENEALEAKLAAQATSKGGLSYQLTPETGLDELKDMFTTGSERLASTYAALERDDVRGGAAHGSTARHSPLFDSGVMVPIAASERAVTVRRSMKSGGTNVSALSRMTSPAIGRRSARLTAPTNPRFVSLLNTTKFGSPLNSSKHFLICASGLASSTTIARQFLRSDMADFSVTRQSRVASKSR